MSAEESLWLFGRIMIITCMWSHYTSQTIKKNHQKEGDKKENIWMNNGQSFYKFYEKCKTQIQGTQQTLRGETWRKPY